MSWLQEDGESIMDFADPNSVTHNILTINPSKKAVSSLKKADELVSFTKDGKIVVEEEASSDDEDSDEGDGGKNTAGGNVSPILSLLLKTQYSIDI